MLKKWYALAVVAALAPAPAFAGFELGVKAQNVAPFPGPAGVRVLIIDVPGPAASLGLAPGDLILDVDPGTGVGWQRVSSLEQLNAYLQQSQGRVRLIWEHTWEHGAGLNHGEVQLRVADPVGGVPQRHL